jgi:hypothetical protein
MSLPEALTLRIELLHIQPVVFRRVVVAGDITLPVLHEVIQAAFGWKGYHLHEFIFGENRYAPPGMLGDLGFDEPMPVAGVRLGDAREGAARFRYVYDFGDDWQHLITVEESASADAAIAVHCIDGANASPPEDVGGPPGFMDFVAAMSDPGHEDHADMMHWHGKRFDPKRFDRGVVNRRLRKIKS